MQMDWSTPMIGFGTSLATPPPALKDERLLREWSGSGRFFLPGSDQSCWGLIRFRPGAPIELALSGNLFGGRAPGRPVEVPVLHGVLTEGHVCTLYDCYCTVAFNQDADGREHCRTTISTRHGTVGGHFSAVEKCIASSMRVRFSHVDQWIGSPYEVDTDLSGERTTVLFQQPSLKADVVFREQRVSLAVGCSRPLPWSIPPGGLRWNFAYHLSLTPEAPQHISWYLELASALREMLVFLVGSGVYVLDITGQTESAEAPTTLWPLLPVTVPRVVRLDHTLFSTRLQELPDRFPSMVRSWFEHRERFAVPIAAYAELACSDGISRTTLILRALQTLEHLFGLVWPEDSRCLPRDAFSVLSDWFGEYAFSALEKGCGAEAASLRPDLDVLIRRFGGLNNVSFRTRLEKLFSAIPERELMPILANPKNLAEALPRLLKRMGATRHYLTHFGEDLRADALLGEELEGAALTCWAVLSFWLAKSLLGMTDEEAGDLALAARNATFLVAPEGL
jgi:hypothetical protein